MIGKKATVSRMNRKGQVTRKKFPHHQVRCPGSLQLRQTVKHIEGVLALLLDHPVNIYGKGFKPVGKWNAHALDLRTFRYKLRMTGKSEIDDFSAVLFSLFHKRI